MLFRKSVAVDIQTDTRTDSTLHSVAEPLLHCGQLSAFCPFGPLVPSCTDPQNILLWTWNPTAVPEGGLYLYLWAFPKHLKGIVVFGYRFKQNPQQQHVLSYVFKDGIFHDIDRIRCSNTVLTYTSHSHKKETDFKHVCICNMVAVSWNQFLRGCKRPKERVSGLEMAEWTAVTGPFCRHECSD
jgi:hypothetical protein